VKKVVFLAVVGIILTACDREKTSIVQGQQLFEQKHIGKSLGCITCHSLKSGENTLGPNLSGISTRAGLVQQGQTAKDYIYESIVNPDGYIVQGYEPGIMHATYVNELSEQDIQALVAFLLTQ
jgi:cytochrome c2